MRVDTPNMSQTLHRRIDRTLRVAVGMATGYVLDAAREVAAEEGRPVMVIASRRQVESVDAGTGYVGLSTAGWCARAAGGDVLLGRDHGGPYQHPRDITGEVDPSTAMKFAAESFREDIEAGVDLIHVDTCLGAEGLPEDPRVACDRAVELVAGCVEVAAAAGREVAYEVGIEVQDTGIADAAGYAGQMRELLGRLRAECGVTPAFLVAQTGTKVVRRTNIGVLATPGDRQPLRDLASVVRGLGSRLKAHNCDYLDAGAVAQLHRAGAWMNVSPEFGVVQTLAVVRAAREARVGDALDAFCAATVDSGAWRKWTGGAEVSDDDKVALGGSYLFAGPAFAELRERLDRVLLPHGGSAARIATDAVKTAMRHYAGT